MDIYLIRHTTPNVKKGIVYGQLDLDISYSFEEEARVIQSLIPDTDRLVKVYSSPLQRCIKLAEKLSTDFVTDDRLKELSFGDWEGMRWDQLDTGKLDKWMENFTEIPPPGGESMKHLKQRVQLFWVEVLQQQESPVAIITHAGVIRVIRSMILNKPLKSAFELKLNYGSVIRCNPEAGEFELLTT